jgi:hypothetical protein
MPTGSGWWTPRHGSYNMELYRWVRNHGLGGVEGFYGEFERLWRPAMPPAWYLASYAYLSAQDRKFRWWRSYADPTVYEEAMDGLVTAAGMDDVDRQWWMTPTQLRDLHRSGHVIGNHTHSHPYDITKLSIEHQCLEYATAKAVLAGVLECNPRTLTTLSHPRGFMSPDAPSWLAGNGFTMAWGATMEGHAPWMTPRWSTGNWTI